MRIRPLSSINNCFNFRKNSHFILAFSIHSIWINLSRKTLKVTVPHLLFLFLFQPLFAFTSISEAAFEPLLEGNSPEETLIPFQIIGKLVVIQATIANQTGNYIVDTGTSYTLLNTRYFSKGTGISSDLHFNALSGQLENMETKLVDIQIGELIAYNVKAVLTDMAHLERIKQIKIMGFIGFSFLKNYEIYFDYQSQEMRLYKLDKHGNKFKKQAYDAPPSHLFSLKMNEHFPCLTAFVEKNKLSFCLDTGAETTLLRKNLRAKLKNNYLPKHKVKVTGFANSPSIMPIGQLKNLYIEDLNYPLQEVVLADLSSYNSQLEFPMDGLLGFEFFYRYRLAINFKKRALYVWTEEKEEELLAKSYKVVRQNPQIVSDFAFYQHPKFKGKCLKKD